MEAKRRRQFFERAVRLAVGAEQVFDPLPQGRVAAARALDERGPLGRVGDVERGEENAFGVFGRVGHQSGLRSAICRLLSGGTSEALSAAVDRPTFQADLNRRSQTSRRIQNLGFSLLSPLPSVRIDLLLGNSLFVTRTQTATAPSPPAPLPRGARGRKKSGTRLRCQSSA